MTDLGTLGGTDSAGRGINNSGRVVGSSWTAGDIHYHPFLYSGGTMIDLGTLGGTRGIAYGINDSGQVVGSALTVGDVGFHAFLYSGGTMFDLNSLVVSGLGGGALYEAMGINNSGQIVANSCGSMGCQAVLLDPIVSPTIPTLSRSTLGAMTLLLLATGLFFRRRLNG